ncbi:MAG: ATP-grasp domain-containing protein [Pseudomonadota bacterium]|nr:ATP-grasp domain-containing protein [Pseudomonadota bacterium]
MRVDTQPGPGSDERPRVLVLDGHSKAAAATVLALADFADVDVATVRLDAPSCASPRVQQRLHQQAAVDTLADWVGTADRAAGYTLIVPSTEAALVALKSQTLDPALRAKLLLPDEASIDIALDKHRTWSMARALGVPVPEAVLVKRLDRVPECPQLPVAIKPLTSKVQVDGRMQSLSVRICRTEAERTQAYRELLPYNPVVEQQYFRGHGIGVELLFEHGEPRWCFAHERIHELPISGGGSTYRRAITAPPAIEQAAIAMLRKLQWHGVAMVEFKLADDGGFCLIEINPRLWGSLPLAVAAGVNFPLGLLRLASGTALGSQPGYRRNFYARNVGADVQWFVQAYRARSDPLTVKQLTAGDCAALFRPLLGNECWDLFNWREPQVWWALTRKSLTRIANGVRRRAGGNPNRALH